jgi:hypothetical protein
VSESRLSVGLLASESNQTDRGLSYQSAVQNVSGSQSPDQVDQPPRTSTTTIDDVDGETIDLFIEHLGRPFGRRWRAVLGPAHYGSPWSVALL